MANDSKINQNIHFCIHNSPLNQMPLRTLSFRSIFKLPCCSSTDPISCHFRRELRHQVFRLGQGFAENCERGPLVGLSMVLGVLRHGFFESYATGRMCQMYWQGRSLFVSYFGCGITSSMW